MTTLLPALPSTQVLNSVTFRSPSLDGSLSLAEIYDWHFTNTQNHRVFVFSDDNQNTRTIYWPEAVGAVYNAGQFLRNKIGEEPKSPQSVPIVAILSTSDTVLYFTMIMAIIRADYIAFPISPRNSPSAVAHLIKSIGVHYILVGNDPAMSALANDSLQDLKTNYGTQAIAPTLIPMPRFADLFSEDGLKVNPMPPTTRNAPKDIVLYLHSSGSTAYPKPIPFTNRRLFLLAIIPYFGEQDLTDKVFSIHSMPMYHTMGVAQCGWTASCGLVVSSFAPKSPAVTPSPYNVYESALATHSDIIFCVPSVIEAWSREPKYVKWLATRGGVPYGGGPLNKSVGNFMTSQGVSVFILYGLTESGILNPIIPAKVGYDWDYFKFPELLVNAKMVPYGDNTFEFVLVPSTFTETAVINTKIGGVDAHATSDLMTPHPTKPGYWRVYGRTDDQIMHSTGEKTNPGPLENMLNQDPHVLSSVMFGRGKFQAGIIVDPKPVFKFDPSRENELELFRNKIWPTIQMMNKLAPQHSRIFKEMILVAKPDMPFQYTAKSTPRRQVIIAQYEAEIENMYSAVELTAQAHIPLPVEWNIKSATDFVRAVVNGVLVHDVEDEDDIFQQGCDSLQATWIRNSLSRALRLWLQQDIRKNTDNFVYQYPSIYGLATFLLAHISDENVNESSILTKEQEMVEMAERYSTNFSQHLGKKAPSAGGKRVLLTGSTGGLGAFVLYSLVADDNVECVYCINRPGRAISPTLIERQHTSLANKGLDIDLLQSAKIRLLQAQSEKENWGLEMSLYDEMHQSVTHIIHNAWPVDFNLTLKTFETNVKGLRNLIDFSLSSPLLHPPTVMYTSTISVFQNLPSTIGRYEELPIEAKMAIGTGYSESKWVSEQILHAASNNSTLKTIVVRVGQLSGGPNGSWNTKEWLPALVQSAKFISCLPIDHADVSWLPIQSAAQSLVDFLQCSEPGIVHLVNPKSTSWIKLANVLSFELSVPLVPYHEWLSKLEDFSISTGSSESNGAVAALRLLDFYRNTALKVGQDMENLNEAFGLPWLSSSRAEAMSRTLREVGQLNDIDVKGWIAYWRAVKFI